MRTLLILLLFYAEVKTSGLARYQRGDQGPDNDEVMHIDTTNVITDMVIPPMGGPNVCRSRSRTFCCPGWHQRGTTGLCLVPVCSSDRCGSNGRCIKPNLCLCEGGKIASHCGQNIENEGKFDIHSVAIVPICGHLLLNSVKRLQNQKVPKSILFSKMFKMPQKGSKKSSKRFP